MPLMVLDNTGTSSVKKLQVLLAGAVGATELPITVSYIEGPKDRVGEAGGMGGVVRSSDAITTGATEVDVLSPSPNGHVRSVVGLSIYNADSSSATVTVREYVSSTVTRIVTKVILLTAQTLLYSESRGFYVLDANGAQKTTAATEASTADSKAESAATRASVALSAATSLDTATDTAFSAGDSVVLSSVASLATVAASVALSQATSLDTATDTAVSTALSTATSAGLNASTAQSNDTRQSTDQSTMRSLLNSGGQAGF